MTRFKLIGFIASLLLMAGCSIPSPYVKPLEPENPDSAILAISVKFKPPLGPSQPAICVMFTRLGGVSDDPKQIALIPSNYSKEGRVYLLNATPGQYVAAIAYHYSVAPFGSRTTDRRSTVSCKGGAQGYWVFFPQKAIFDTRIKVTPKKINYMGDINLESSISMDSSDEQQMFYFNLMRDIWGRQGGSHRAYRGENRDSNKDSQTEKNILAQVELDFKGTDWERMFAR